MNVMIPLFESFEKHRSHLALGFDERWVSYREIQEEVLKRALWLQESGIRKGDRVGLMLPKGLSFIYWHLAILGIGAISLPINPAHRPDEVLYLLTDAGGSLLITTSGLYEPLRKTLGAMEGLWVLLLDGDAPSGMISRLQATSQIRSDGFHPVPTDWDDTALILYTSGTTGKPKGAMITHRNLIFNLQALQDLWEWTSADILLHVLPLYHIHGLVAALHTALFCGSKVILMEKFDPRKAWEILERKKCTLFTAVPTIYYRMLREWESCRVDLSAMRIFISGAAPLSELLFHRFAQTTGFRIMERYGMTEAGIIASNPLDPSRRLPKSVGYPLPGVEVAILSEEKKILSPGEIGEVWVRGDNVFQGYWKNPEKTREALDGGWFRTGDLGFLDAADPGRIYLVGRAKELIISGGENVYPLEVESVLERHPAIQEAAVIGLPDEDFGERVTAVVTCKKGKTPPSAKEVIHYCKEHLVGFKCPKEVYFVEQLPRNSLGKVEKMLLRQRLSASAEEPSFPGRHPLAHG